MSSYYIFDTSQHVTNPLGKNLDAGKYMITNLKTYPEHNNDVASKKYVDDENAKKLSLDSSSSMSDNLNMGGHKIINLATPTTNGDAIEKKYLEDNYHPKTFFNQYYNKNVSDSRYFTQAQVNTKLGGYLRRNGHDHMTGLLDMRQNRIRNVPDPLLDTEVATKNYTDNLLDTKISRDGSISMTGNLSMGLNRVRGLDAPQTNSDAATKKYVDDKVAAGTPSLNNVPKLNKSNTYTGNHTQTIPKAIVGDLTCSWYGSSSSLLFKQFFIRHPLNTNAGWYIGNQKPAPTTSDNDLYFLVRYTDGSESSPGYISDSESLTKMNDFTGQHRCVLNTKYRDELQGRIVECTGRYQNFDGSTTPSINESLPVVAICNSVASQKVFGVLSGEEDVERRIIRGKFVSTYKKLDHCVFVNSVGEGAMWVCNSAGNLSIGDYIESFKLGYGRKQKSKTLKNSTVAKITQSCDFASGTKVMMSGVEYLVAFVGCTYHCG